MKPHRSLFRTGRLVSWPAVCALLALTFSGCGKSTTSTAEAPPAGSASASLAKPWPQDRSDVKPDPAAIYGALPNGLRYIILPNKEPPGRLSLRLRVNAGSLMESDAQQGLAHFL